MFCKKGVLRNFAKFTGKHLCQSLFFKKETLAQVFSCEFCGIFKNTFFYRTPLVAASALSLLLIHKAEKNNAKKVDNNEMILYLKSQYSTNNRNQIVFVQNSSSIEELSSFEGIREELKIILKHTKDGENMSLRNNPAGIYLLQVNNRNTRTRCEICSKLTINTPERRHWRRSGVFIVNFEHISHLVLVFLLLTLNK